jgi:hypothetical protein
MNPSTAQTLCQVGIAVFAILGILCTYGSYHFGKQLEKLEKFKDEKKIEKILTDSKSELKEAIVKEIENLYKRLTIEDNFQKDDIEKAAKMTYEIAKNGNANLLVKKDMKRRWFWFWFTPMWNKSPHRKFYLADFVGNITKNRISVFVTEEAKLICQVLTSDGRDEQISVNISSWVKNEPHLIIVDWKSSENKLTLHLDKDKYEKNIPNLHFDKLGPVIFIGIDFEGNFPSKLGEGGPKISEGFKRVGFKEFKQEKSQEESAQIIRPHIFIKPDNIEYSNWTEQERKDDPKITELCNKIILYFLVNNASDQPAANIDISATSQIIDKKGIGKFTPGNWKTSYTHSLHLITKENPGRQPFTLALDKKATNLFKNGDIKVQLVIKVIYTNLINDKSYWTEASYIYSPVFEKNAEEIYSKGT